MKVKTLEDGEWRGGLTSMILCGGHFWIKWPKVLFKGKTTISIKWKLVHNVITFRKQAGVWYSFDKAIATDTMIGI